MDEIAICHDYLFESPSTLPNETTGITWLIGMIKKIVENEI